MSEQTYLKMIQALVDALTEWPHGWHDDKASGRKEYEVFYTVAKARRMGRLVDRAQEILAACGPSAAIARAEGES